MRVRTMAEVGAVIRDARERAELTQAALAGRARVSREWLIKVENGRTSAEMPRIMDVLASLDLSLDIRRDGE